MSDSDDVLEEFDKHLKREMKKDFELSEWLLEQDRQYDIDEAEVS